MKQERWTFRVADEDSAKVSKAATLSGQTLTDFVVESAVSRADLLIAEHRPMTMGHEEFERFSAALDEAPAAISELVDLFSRKTSIPER